MFEKVMYKVKEKTFRIKDFTSGDNVNESKFVETTNQRNKKRLETQVCVFYKDEYEEIKTKLDAHDNEVQHLKAMIEERESQIMKLKKEIKDNEGSNIDEVIQLKEDISTMKEDHQKEVSHLHQEIANIEKSRLEEFEDLKETHANQLLAIDETHKKEIEKLNEQYNAKLDEINDKLLSQVQVNKQTSDNLRDEMLTMTKEHTSEINTLHQEKSNLEIAHANEMNELEKAHHKRVETIRSYFLKVVTLDNTEDTSELIELEKSVPSLFKPFMRNHMKQIEEFKERKLLKEPEKIIKTHELSGEKEKEEQ